MSDSLSLPTMKYASVDPATCDLRVDVASVAANCSVFIATPSHGRVTMEYTASMVRQAEYLHKCSISYQYYLHGGNSLIDFARNLCVAEFMLSSCTHLLFIDDDLEWNERELVKMLAIGVPILGATYGKKNGKEMAHQPKEGPKKRMFGCTEAKALPTGFLLLERGVFEHIAKARPDLKFKYRDERINPWTYAFFKTRMDADGWQGEDYFFCELAEECGFEIWLDYIHKIHHIGPFAYPPVPAARNVITYGS